eukprot:2549562-Pyramimonas_sp.AAC.1
MNLLESKCRIHDASLAQVARCLRRPAPAPPKGGPRILSERGHGSKPHALATVGRVQEKVIADAKETTRALR